MSENTPTTHKRLPENYVDNLLDGIRDQLRRDGYDIPIGIFISVFMPDDYNHENIATAYEAISCLACCPGFEKELLNATREEADLVEANIGNNGGAPKPTAN